MSDGQEVPSKVRVKYQKLPDYKVYHSDSAVARLTETGSIRLDFYTGAYELVDEIGTLKSAKEGFDWTLDKPPEYPYTKLIQVGVVLKPDDVQVLIDRLKATRDLYEKQKAERKQ